MNGKDLLIALSDINPVYYVEAASDSPSATQKRLSFRRPLLAAVIIALTLLLTVSAVACAYGWLAKFFNTQSGSPLSPGQAAYIEENEQVVGQSQTHDGWTVQLKSAINDGRSAYIILGVTAPKKIELESAESAEYYLGGEFADLISNNRNIEIDSEVSGWEPDGDGKANTMDYVIRLDIDGDVGTPSPFGADVEWSIHIENIICQKENTESLQSQLDGQHEDQDEFLLFSDEMDTLYQQETAARGIWDFRFTFSQTSSGIELVTTPITVHAYAQSNSTSSYQEVTITRFVLNAFSARIEHTADALVTFKAPVLIVLRDGSEMELRHFSSTRTITTLNSDTPIVLAEVDHIRLPDGTILRTEK